MYFTSDSDKIETNQFNYDVTFHDKIKLIKKVAKIWIWLTSTYLTLLGISSNTLSNIFARKMQGLF